MPKATGDVTLETYGDCGCGSPIVRKSWDPEQAVPLYICLGCGGEYNEEDVEED